MEPAPQTPVPAGTLPQVLRHRHPLGRLLGWRPRTFLQKFVVGFVCGVLLILFVTTLIDTSVGYIFPDAVWIDVPSPAQLPDRLTATYEMTSRNGINHALTMQGGTTVGDILFTFKIVNDRPSRCPDSEPPHLEPWDIGLSGFCRDEFWEDGSLWRYAEWTNTGTRYYLQYRLPDITDEQAERMVRSVTRIPQWVTCASKIACLEYELGIFRFD